VTDGTLQQDIQPELEAPITVPPARSEAPRPQAIASGRWHQLGILCNILGYLQERSIAYI